jgi:SpoIID/LytB domain protein
VAAVALSAGLVFVSAPRPASAYPYPEVTLQGHGFGHGLGMGQWGALGSAVAGDTWQQIIGQFYGTLANGQPTAIASSPCCSDTGTLVTVAINENAGNDVIVTSASAFEVSESGGNLVQLPAGSGALFHLVNGSSDQWEVFTNPGGGAGPCAGGASGWGQPVASGVPHPVAEPGVAEPFPGDANLDDEVLQLCMGSGQPCVSGGNLCLRGDVSGTVNSAGAPRTVDELPLEQYVADVVPAESPTSWATLAPSAPSGAGPPPGTPAGDGWGFQELEAQAVAARSYVLSTYNGSLSGYFGYADICDTTACQAYPGILDENTTTDAAVTGTASQVVVEPHNGDVIPLTQYSASTGGYSAPGVFQAVPDPGDALCIPGACNPHHDWTAQIPVSAIESTYPQIGTLLSLDVTERNGFGDYGGRVEQMTIEGSAGSVQTTGAAFAAAFAADNVQSDWFEVENQPSGGEVGYWVAGADGGIFAFGSAGFYGSMGGRPLDAPVVSMAATPDDGGYWEVAADGGIFSFGDARFEGSMGGQHLDAPMVGMAADPAGGYWTVAADGGVFAFGAPFEGSMGGQRLNAPMVGMAADPAGGYWTVAADGGVFSFGGARFYGSAGDIHLAQPVVGMAATPDGGGYWLVAADGGVFSFGDAAFEGSLPGQGISARAVALLADGSGQGYEVLTADGQVVAFGDAPQFGEPASSSPSDAMVGGAADVG